MSIQPSPEVNAMIFILTGEKLIDADEDLAYESRRPYSGLGRKLDRMSELIDKSIHDIAESMPDDLSKSYAKAMGMLIDDGGKNYLREFAEQLDKIAEGRRKTSMDIMESKWQVIAEVIRLLIEIAIYLAMSFFTGGATASQIMMAKLRSRFMILTTLSHLLQRLHLAPSLTEAFAEAFTTFAVRLAMMNFAPDGRRPDGIDWNDILKSAAFGAAAGGLTSFFDSWARNIVNSYDNNFLKNGPDLDFKNNPNLKNNGPGPDLTSNRPHPDSKPGPDPAPGPDTPHDRPDPTPAGSGPDLTHTPVTFRDNPLSFRNNPDLWRNNQLWRNNADRPGALAGHYGLKGTADFLAAGAGEALAEILIKGAFDGDWSTSWSTFVGAGLSSQVEATLSDIAVNSGAELRHVIDRLRLQPPAHRLRRRQRCRHAGLRRCPGLARRRRGRRRHRPHRRPLGCGPHGRQRLRPRPAAARHRPEHGPPGRLHRQRGAPALRRGEPAAVLDAGPAAVHPGHAARDRRRERAVAAGPRRARRRARAGAAGHRRPARVAAARRRRDRRP
ncbi:hypothetical protein RKD24_005164 [Streptomyces calvus]